MDETNSPAGVPESSLKERLEQEVQVEGFGQLTQSFMQALAEAVSEDKQQAVLGQFDYEQLDQTLADILDPSLMDGIPGLVESLADDEMQIANFLRDVWKPADDIFRAQLQTAHEMAAWIKLGRGSGALALACADLLARACRIGNEIRFLAMNGFVAAAEARWRSLHEVAVTAIVLAEGDENLAQRYLASSSLERWRDMQTYQQHAERLQRTPYSDAELDDARSAKEAAAALYEGLERREYGWALPLFPEAIPNPRHRITFAMIEEKAALTHLRPFYRYGSHHVHAGARAGELNVRECAQCGTSARVGADVHADIAEVCHGAMISICHVAGAFVAAVVAETPAHLIDLRVAGAMLIRFQERGGDAYVAASDIARQRGLLDRELE